MEEEPSQENSNMFSVRIVTFDYYMSPPIPNFDISYSKFQGGSVKEVPVIRIYGATPAGQKACVHVHRALPNFYVPCSDIPLQINPEGSIENSIFLAVEKALKLKGKSGSRRQHVHSCTLVRARKFYGYHSSEELFIKIYLYYPHDVSRAANLLLSGAVFEKCLQPYESHIPFLLQFLVDYNLYGMGHMHLVKMKFRHPVPDDCLAENADHFSPEAFASTSSDSQARATANLRNSPLFWRSSTIPTEWMWQNSFIHGASSSHVDNMMKRQSICELEGDTTVQDILNQQLKMYTSLSQTCSDVRMVQSLVPIWEEEFERSGLHEAEMLADPGRPSPQYVLKTLSNGIEYVHKLLGLYGKAESGLVAASEDVKSIVSSQCPRKEGGSEDADAEDVALLNWLASSQAAEEFNSDDDLQRETILNPLLPAATIDKVLEKANTDYENESQQECQDILDSIVDVLKSDDQMGKTSVVEDSSHSKIPQLDGAGDDQQLSPAAGSSEKMHRVSVFQAPL